MKITSTNICRVRIPLKEPYTIAYETLGDIEAVFIRAETDDGITGYGCAAPDPGVTGENGDSVLKAWNETFAPLLKGAGPFRYSSILEEMKGSVLSAPSAIAMCDMMLFDLVSKKAGVPLYQYLGAYRQSIATSVTIGILPLGECLEKAGQLFSQGFRIIKLKGGNSVEEDIEKVMKLREKFSKNLTIRFDANQGYSLEEAIRFVDKTREAGIELLEQPTPKKDKEMLGKVSNRVNIPVMADESLMNLRDVFNLTSNNLTDMINVKLMKVGGIYEGLQINSVARSGKVETMVGCMDEPELAISAGLHFALSRPNILFADLDGHMDLAEDPTGGCFDLKDGILYPTGLPGLGLKNPEKLEKLF